jgi:predicted TIM-barrel fold metal-dependent hydrolase
MRIVDVRCRPSYPGFRELFRPSWAKERLGAPIVEYVDSPEGFLALLDAEGIELCVVTGRDQTSRGGRAFRNTEIATLVTRYPARMIGMAGVDTGVGVRKMLAQAREGVEGLGLEGLSVDPNLSGLTPSDRLLYPLYAYAEERELPVMITMGPLPIPRNLTDMGLPHHVDLVARDFPGLRVVMSHGVWPSPTEMLACMWKNPNVYIEGSLYLGAPGTMVLAENPAMLTERFMFGSGYPVVPIGWMKSQYEKLGLTGEPADRMWWQNALRLFKRLP